MANTGKYVTYGIFAGDYIKNNKKITLILTGFIISEDQSHSDEPDINQKELVEPEGTVYFENPKPSAGEGLLMTKPVSSGIEEWKIWLQEASKEKGKNEVMLVEDEQFGNVVKFQRSSKIDDGGGAGIYQETDIKVSHFKSLYLWLVGKVEYESGGNIANRNPQWFPEGAV